MEREQRERLERRVAVAAVVVVTLVLVLFPVFDYDLYWHLANGREMLASGSVVNEELFSYTRLGTPFSNHEWLSQIFLYLIYTAFGTPGLLVFKVVLSIAVALLTFSTVRLVGARPFAVAVLAITAVATGIFRYTERPDLFSTFGFSLLLYLLMRFRSGGCTWGCVVAVPAIILVWEWLHGAIFGLALLGLFFIIENARALIERRHAGVDDASVARRSRLRMLNYGAAAVILVELINPYGIRSYDIFVEFVRGTGVANTMEFQPATFDDHPLLWVLVVVTLSLAALVRARVDAFLFSCAVLFGVLSVR
jgi:hypothetical protein